MNLEMEIVSLNDDRRRKVLFEPKCVVCSEFAGDTQILGGDQKGTLPAIDFDSKPIPHFFPVSPHLLTNADVITVQGKRTSGEVEYVSLKFEGEIYITVGSDHCDRAVESFSIAKSKQLCNKVIGRQMILYQELRPLRDVIKLSSYVQSMDRKVLYQSAALTDLMRLGSLLRSCPLNLDFDGAVLFSGTVPTITDIPAFSSHFYFQLEVLQRNFTISHDYAIEVLPEAI